MTKVLYCSTVHKVRYKDDKNRSVVTIYRKTAIEAEKFQSRGCQNECKKQYKQDAQSQRRQRMPRIPTI